MNRWLSKGVAAGLVCSGSWASILFAADYPMLISTITRAEADYSTPENTLASVRSAMEQGDLEWADQAMTQEALEEDKRAFEEAGVDRNRRVEIERGVDRRYIIKRVDYKDVVMMVIEDHEDDGSVMRFPITLIEENELWKITNKYAGDDVLAEYLDYVPPLFDGKGQKPGDVNAFLRYAQPMQETTQLAPGVLTYTLHVYYGPTTDSTTFRAELNKEDVTELFAPEPAGDQEVELPMQGARNVLTLSISGVNGNGKAHKDRDRLVFLRD